MGLEFMFRGMANPPQRSVSDLDLSVTNAKEGNPIISGLADTVESYLRERFPAAQRFKHRRRQLKHSEQPPYLVGTRVVVRRGLMWGYAVTLIPNGTKVGVNLSDDPGLIGLVIFGSLVPIVLLVASLFLTGKVPVGQIIAEGDSVRFLGLGVVVLIFLWLVLMSLSWHLMRRIRSRKIDQQAQAAEMDDLRDKLRDLLVTS